MILSYSGGLDSTTLLYKYQKDIKLAVSFRLASKQNEKELFFAKYHCEKLGIQHIVVDITNLFAGFKSALLQGNSRKIVGDTIVPFRNGIMLAILASMAEENNIKHIALANHTSGNASYPDTRKVFIDNITKAIQEGTTNRVEVFAPFTSISKREVALIGKEIGIEYNKTWTCYEGEDKHCGECLSCAQRKAALEGFDETEYQC